MRAEKCLEVVLVYNRRPVSNHEVVGPRGGIVRHGSLLYCSSLTQADRLCAKKKLSNFCNDNKIQAPFSNIN